MCKFVKLIAIKSKLHTLNHKIASLRKCEIDFSIDEVDCFNVKIIVVNSFII